MLLLSALLIAAEDVDSCGRNDDDGSGRASESETDPPESEGSDEVEETELSCEEEEEVGRRSILFVVFANGQRLW